ncbi:hypothetical protein L484_009901 [Morus notabilis]|uniref:Uncharacterized protein n=1 Tax=Morus notabilis TaxID=981085 RepID=W9S205_9ROSA|nr:pentatricopeptide repeat-containing protein At3g56030, mitochondrial [Morus notabilis]EXC04708.1 hypothetical protein L484_009901 [Morus notabilis]
MSLIRKFPIKTLQFRHILTLSNLFSTSANPNPPSNRPATAHYDEMVNAAGRSGNYDELRRLLNRRVKDGCYNTTSTFNFVTVGDDSISAVGRLCETLARLDKGYVMKGAFDALVARLCKIARIDESRLVIEAMAPANCGLDARTFHPVIKGLTRKNQVDVAWRVVDVMRERGVSPDTEIYNRFLTMHCGAGDVEAAAAVLERMVKVGLKPNGRTCDALVMGACRAGKVEGALVLLRRMEDDGVPMLLSTRLYVVDALLSLGYYDQAVRFVRVYGGRDTWLDAESFGCLAIRLVKLNRTDEARMVLEEMKTRGLEMRHALKSLLKYVETSEN